jgi:hypothetical protein
MYRLRPLLVLACLAVLGASVAGAQDGTGTFNNQDKQSDHNSTQDKAKTKTTTTSNDNHRKHWWSPPHWPHKKHDNAAGTSRTGQSPFNKAGAADNTAKSQTVKTADNKTVALANKPKINSSSKSVTAARPTATKTVATTETAGKNTPGNSQSKKTATTTAGKKPVRHDCTPEHVKKGSCAADKASNQKGIAKPS